MFNVYIPVYNSLFCAEYQIKTIRTFLKEDDVQIIIFDNNCGRHKEASEKLESLCEKEGVEYIYNSDPQTRALQDVIESDKVSASDKLGWTLNIIWNHVKYTKPDYFGFLDQDCFLFEPTEMRSILDRQGAYGKVVPTHPDEKYFSAARGLFTTRSPCSHVWNLHVIANFYKTSYLLEKDSPETPVNFMPGTWGEFFGKWRNHLDTGGMNWFSVWRNEDPKTFALTEDHYYYYDDTTLLDPDNEHPTRTLYEVLDSRWIHMVHGALSASSTEYLNPKASYIKGFLDSNLMKAKSSFRKDTGFRSNFDPRGEKEDVS